MEITASPFNSIPSSRSRTRIALDADHVGRVAGVRAAALEVAITRERARALIACDGRRPRAALTGDADFVVVAGLAALTAVTRIRLRMDAGRAVVSAGLVAHSAVLHAHPVFATRRIARTNVAYGAAVRGARKQVDAEAVHLRVARSAGANAIGAVLVVLALRVAISAAIGIVLRIAAGVVAIAAGGRTTDAGASAGVTQAEVAVAVVAALAAMPSIRIQVDARRILTAIHAWSWARALSRDTCARSAAIRVAIAASRGIRGNVAASKVPAALDLARVADARTGDALAHAAIRSALPAARGIRRKIAASLLIAAIDLTWGAHTSTGNTRATAAIRLALAAMRGIRR